MIETPQSFGPDESLLGVLTVPSVPGPAPAPAVAFLLFNAGVIPRTGPHRMNVKLAHALAAQGHAVLRFDLSGHGDSRPAAAGADPQWQGARDLSAAMDHLEATLGVRRFAVLGVCSGAVNAYHVGVADPRVAGLLMFDGFWYRSRRSRWVRDLKFFWATPRDRAWRGLLHRVRLRFGPRADADQQTIYQESSNPAPGEFCEAMGQLVARGAAVFVVYSGSVIDYYSYGAQFRHVFGGEPWFGQVRCDFMPDVDHSFLEQRSQQRFIAAVIGWLPAVRKAAALP